MAVDIGPNYNSGGAEAQPNQGNPNDLKLALQAAQSDLAELRTQIIALLVKIDADSGDTGGDSDYESSLTPAALNLTQS